MADSYMPSMMAPFATIKCPSCYGAAEFSHVTYKTITNNELEYFKKSKNFKVFQGQHSHGSYYKAALYYPGLGNSLENIKDLPEGYHAAMWQHRYSSVGLPEKLKGLGSIRCSDCLIQKAHKLEWPKDAYFQITYKGKTLWAFDRKYTLKLLSYIESKERQKRIVGHSGKEWNKIYSQDWFLRHIPEHFQTAKARSEIFRKLKAILET